MIRKIAIVVLMLMIMAGVMPMAAAETSVEWISTVGSPHSYCPELDWMTMIQWDEEKEEYVPHTVCVGTGANIEFENLTYIFSDGMAVVMRDEKYGFIDQTGEIAIPLDYDGAENFSEGLARVWRNGKCGMIDMEGNVVIPLEYENMGDIHEDMAWVFKEGKCGFVDRNGKTIVPLEYDGAASFSKGMAKVLKNGKCGFIDKEGSAVMPLEYDDAGWTEDAAWVKKGASYGVVRSDLADAEPQQVSVEEDAVLGPLTMRERMVILAIVAEVLAVVLIVLAVVLLKKEKAKKGEEK